MKHGIAKALVSGYLLGTSAIASAFTPAGGLWGFTNELNGQPGRGFQLTVENDTLVFYYYGYDSDGKGNYMFASGPLVGGSVFSAQLLVCRGGTVMGTAYKAANCTDGPGKVSMNFSSGEKGTITLPGEAPKPISRFNFGYTDGPEALLGEFLFAYKATTFSNVDIYKLTTKTGIVTNMSGMVGTGIVSNVDYTFGCEFYPINGPFRSVYVCTEATQSDNDDIYIFRMVGDRGSGTGTWYGDTGSYVHPTQVLRLATAKGTRTAPYNESYATVTAGKSSSQTPVAPAEDPTGWAKVNEPPSAAVVGEFDEQEWAFARDWAEQARASLAALRVGGK